LSQSLVNSTIHCSESIRAMGMVERAVRRWYLQKQKQIIKQDKMTHYSTCFTTAAKFFRMVLQISILGVGAALVVRYSSGQAAGVFTAGGMIAASILTARAMAPVEKLIGTWKRFLEVRQSLKRIHHFMDASSDVVKSTLMTDLSGALFLDNVIYRPKPGADPIIKGVNLRIDAGDVVAIIGPSGAGKSTLARLMLGIWRPDHGAVMMDGYDLTQCQRKDIGARIGYCPQRVQLIAATVKDNISRLSDACDEDIVAAAKMVGAHTMIQSLAEGYQTVVRPYIMSGGQQQRVGLAQAFYGDPCFVVLDEPDSNLDDEGVRSLGMALQQAKQKGTTIVLVTHRASYLRWVDKVVVMADGAVQAYGPAEQIMQRLQQSNTTPPPNYKPSH
jgi:PrtD family type I secretion system ABC transporter